MRKHLDSLYDGAAALAAVLMVALLGMVLLSILGRQLHFHVPGTDAYAGYLMAGSGFLALAHTLKRGEHIRVTLLLGALTGGLKKGLEILDKGTKVFPNNSQMLDRDSLNQINDVMKEFFSDLTITPEAAQEQFAAIIEAAPK